MNFLQELGIKEKNFGASTGIEWNTTTDQGELNIVSPVDGKQIALIYHRHSFYALDNACPHKFASLCVGDLKGDQIICPWHGAGFNITTGESFSPLAPRGLNSYPVTVRNQLVFIDL